MSYRRWDIDEEGTEYYLVDSVLYIARPKGCIKEMFCGKVSLPVESVEFQDYMWLDEMYREDVRGIKVLVNGTSTQLREHFTYEDLLKKISNGYDRTLLSDIREILGLNSEVKAVSGVIPMKRSNRENCSWLSGEEVQTQLTELALENARLVKIITDQPLLIGVLKKIAQLEKNLDEALKGKEQSEKELIKQREEVECVRAQYSSLQVKYKELEEKYVVFEQERDLYKHEILKRVKQALFL